MTDDPTQEFGTRSETQAIIAAKKEKKTSYCNAPVLPEPVEDS